MAGRLRGVRQRARRSATASGRRGVASGRHGHVVDVPAARIGRRPRRAVASAATSAPASPESLRHTARTLAGPIPLIAQQCLGAARPHAGQLVERGVGQHRRRPARSALCASRRASLRSRRPARRGSARGWLVARRHSPAHRRARWPGSSFCHSSSGSDSAQRRRRRGRSSLRRRARVSCTTGRNGSISVCSSSPRNQQRVDQLRRLRGCFKCASRPNVLSLSSRLRATALALEPHSIWASSCLPQPVRVRATRATPLSTIRTASSTVAGRRLRVAAPAAAAGRGLAVVAMAAAVGVGLAEVAQDLLLPAAMSRGRTAARARASRIRPPSACRAPRSRSPARRTAGRGGSCESPGRETAARS